MQIPLFQPQTEWVKPEKFPDLTNRQEVAIDLETSDPDLKKEYKLDSQLQWYDAFTAVGPHTKTYIRAMRSNGEDLRRKPRIKILTLHSSKGGEATNVIILQNQTRNTIKGARKSMMKQDEEQRVWYVGLTRCSKNLFLIRCKDRSKEFKI